MTNFTIRSGAVKIPYQQRETIYARLYLTIVHSATLKLRVQCSILVATSQIGRCSRQKTQNRKGVPLSAPSQTSKKSECYFRHVCPSVPTEQNDTLWTNIHKISYLEDLLTFVDTPRFWSNWTKITDTLLESLSTFNIPDQDGLHK